MNSLRMKYPVRPLAVLVLSVSLGACTLGPDYQRPDTPIAGEFKQAEGWKPATPADHFLGEPWWHLYGDAELNALVERLNVSNQNLAIAEAQYRQARALVRGARAGFFPTLSGNVGNTRSGRGAGGGTTTLPDGSPVSTSGAGGVSESYDLNLAVSWELDLWGRLRRSLESSQASLQASAADLAAVRLSLQAELVQNYLQLRVLDAEKRLLDATVRAYERSLRISENQYRAGFAPRSDVSQATTQLRSAQAQAIDLRYRRAQLEHAIAVLIGVPPAELTIAEVENIPQLPEIPVLLPSHLLERRPDVAAAERAVMSANAEIGVAKTAWFPSLSLSAAGGYRSGSLDDWIRTPNRFWSIGPEFAMTLFDGGLIRSRIEQAEASYDQTVASYRQTVLDSFREVEDSLVQLRVLAEEAEVQREALEAAQESLRLIENQYRAGMVDFLSVATVQTTALNNERTNLNLLASRLAASVQLATALGGGWHSDQLQAPPELSSTQP